MDAFDPSGIEGFLEFWQQKPNSPEGKMAVAYHQVVLDFDARQTGLLKSIRPQKAGGKIIPVFAESSEQLIAGFEDAEKHLEDVRADIQLYLTLTEGQPSMSSLNDKLFIARRAITEASLEARRTLERALKETNSSSMEEIEGVPAMQAAMDKKDQTQRQLEPVVEDLLDRISKAKSILEKYNRIVL
jgi:hypothetical protein